MKMKRKTYEKSMKAGKTIVFNKNEIITLPNIISLFRLLLIPIFCWQYMELRNDWIAVGVIALSGISDIIDGKIARHFHMVSNFGKMLDPVVDKLTQAAMFFCLLQRFPHMLLPLVVLTFKEIITGIMGLVAIQKSSVIAGAEWPGKLTTVLLYVAVLLHIILPKIHSALSDAIIAICIGCMLFSFVYYAIRNAKAILYSKKVKKSEGL